MTNLNRMYEISNMSIMFNEKPSDILGVKQDYLAWCINEAFYYFMQSVKDGKKPKEIKQKKKYKTISDFYFDLGVDN